jgi:hypothetical protein
VVVAAAVGLPGVASCAELRAINDAWLLEYASTPYEKKFPMRDEVLGTLGGIAVIAEFFCADVCPAYTVRVIHFDVEPGARCASVGGVEKAVTIPFGIAARPQPFCFPSILAQNWDAYVR